jgi:hypothetical protein
MSRRASLPGAAELFRATSAPSAEAALHPGVGAVPPPAVPADATDPPGRDVVSEPARNPARRSPLVRPAGERNPSGRERHDEKITVYCSPEELVDLESARLTLRADHGLAVDRGRLVREALAVVLADLDAKGEASILVRRLRPS